LEKIVYSMSIHVGQEHGPTGFTLVSIWKKNLSQMGPYIGTRVGQSDAHKYPYRSTTMQKFE